VTTAGCAAARAATAAKHASAARAGRAHPWVTFTTSATNAAFSMRIASSWPFHAVGTSRVAAQNASSPAACTYMNAGPG